MVPRYRRSNSAVPSSSTGSAIGWSASAIVRGSILMNGENTITCGSFVASQRRRKTLLVNYHLRSTGVLCCGPSTVLTKTKNCCGSLRASPVSATQKSSKDPLGNCIKPNMERLAEALIGLVHRTLTSNLVAPKTKSPAAFHLQGSDEGSMPSHKPANLPSYHGRRMGWSTYGSFEFGLFLGNADNSDPVTAYHSQAILSIILPRVREQERDERWFQLAIDHLGFTRSDLGNYLAHGDSMALATSIRLLRNIIHTPFRPVLARGCRHPHPLEGP
jgi:hypothetical protein